MIVRHIYKYICQYSYAWQYEVSHSTPQCGLSSLVNYQPLKVKIAIGFNTFSGTVRSISLEDTPKSTRGHLRVLFQPAYEEEESVSRMPWSDREVVKLLIHFLFCFLLYTDKSWLTYFRKI